MDCQNARLLLPFVRPGGRDLGADDAAAVQAHLAGCSACQAFTGAEQRFDAVIGRAMLQVEPPVELHHRIRQRLAQERRRWWRKRVGYLAGAAAVLAAVAVGAVMLTDEARKESVDLSSFSQQLGDRLGAEPLELDDYFNKTRLLPRKRQEKYAAPPDFDYRKCLGYGIGLLSGVEVPRLEFVHYRPDGRSVTAHVYVLHESHFRLKGIDPGTTLRDDASNRSILLRRYPQLPHFAYVVVIFDSGQLPEFLAKPPEGGST
jgi:hypothetical protein